jgi:hypothetical protein
MTDEEVTQLAINTIRTLSMSKRRRSDGSDTSARRGV